MRRLARLAFVALWLVALVCACQRETSPPLIQVTDLGPHEVEQGDHLSIVGVGFPEGKVAHVSFRGDLHRAGELPVRGVTVEVDAVVVTSSEIDIPFTEAMRTHLAGPGDRAVHTTFSGALTVAFSAASPGAPPVAGVLGDTWLDVEPPSFQRGARDAQTAEGNRTLAFLGIKPSPIAPASGGILIESIDPGSPADAARFLAGDVLTEVDGLRVLSPGDVIPEGGARTASLKIRRDGRTREESAQVSLLGLGPRRAAGLFGPIVVLGLAALALWMLLAPTPRAIAWVHRQLASRIRAKIPLFAFAPRPLFVWTAFGGASATFAAMALGHGLVGADLDIGILFLIAVSARAMVALFTGGDARPAPHDALTGYSLVAALRSVVQVTVCQIPAAVGVACAVIMTGSLRLEDIVRAQGGWPWGWTLFRSPVAGTLCCLFLASAVTSAPRTRHRFFVFAEWANLFLMCGLAAALFLGGWRVPGLAPEHMEGNLGLELIGSGVFAAKAWLLVLAVLGARWALPPISIAEVTAFSCKWLVPASVLLLGLAVAWVHLAPGPAIEAVVGAVLLATFCAVALHAALGVRYDLDARTATSDIPLSPFL